MLMNLKKKQNQTRGPMSQWKRAIEMLPIVGGSFAVFLTDDNKKAAQNEWLIKGIVQEGDAWFKTWIFINRDPWHVLHLHVKLFSKDTICTAASTKRLENGKIYPAQMLAETLQGIRDQNIEQRHDDGFEEIKKQPGSVLFSIFWGGRFHSLTREMNDSSRRLRGDQGSESTNFAKEMGLCENCQNETGI